MIASLYLPINLQWWRLLEKLYGIDNTTSSDNKMDAINKAVNYGNMAYGIVMHILLQM